MQIDDGHAIHYAAVERGTPVYSADGVEVGSVHQIVDNYSEHILDGVVIARGGGDYVFCDGPEVARTAERGVTLSIDAGAVAELPPPDPGSPSFRINRGAGRITRLFGGGWKRR